MTAIASASSPPFGRSSVVESAAGAEPSAEAGLGLEAPATPQALDEVTLSQDAKAWLAEQGARPKFDKLDYNTLTAIWNDPENQFTEEQQRAALTASQHQHSALFGPLAAQGQATGDYTALGKAALALFDSLTPEEQARQGGPARRAEMVRNNEVLARLAQKSKDSDEDDEEVSTVLSEMLERMREVTEAYAERLAERAEREAAAEAAQVGERPAPNASASPPSLDLTKAYAAATTAPQSSVLA